MRNILLIACAVGAIAGGASTASADQHGAPAGLFVRVDDHMRYDSPNQDYGYDDGYGYGDNGNYGNNGYYGNGNNSYYGNGNNGYYGNGNNGCCYGSNGGYAGGYSYGGGYGYRGGYNLLPPQTVVRSLYRSGFSYISPPVFDGRNYQVKARDPGGRKVKLYVDASNGQIVRVKH